MKFKLYENKSSIKKKNSRYLQGGDTEIYKERLGWWEQRLDIEKDQVDDITFTITKKYEYKPWLVAKVFLGNENLEWVILQYNEIVDTIDEFVSGRVIKIPSKSRVLFGIITKPTVNGRI